MCLSMHQGASEAAVGQAYPSLRLLVCQAPAVRASAAAGRSPQRPPPSSSRSGARCSRALGRTPALTNCASAPSLRLTMLLSIGSCWESQ